MKILSVRIEAFGKLKDFSTEFDNRFHCVYKENEFGKSTILSFIRAMFYGFPKRTSKDVREYGRNKYAPWNSGSYGGTLTFSHNGRTYRIERRFSGKRAEDQRTLRDENTGAPEDTGDEEIGEYLFGLGESEFVNTFFVGQLASSLHATDRPKDSVADRLANLAASGSEHFSFETADKNLKAASANLIAIRGDGGLIRDMEREREDLIDQRHQAEDVFRRMEETAEQTDQINHRAEVLEKDRLIPIAGQHKAQITTVNEMRASQVKLEAYKIRCIERRKSLEDRIKSQREENQRQKERHERREENLRRLHRETQELDARLVEQKAEAERVKGEIKTLSDKQAAREPELQNAYQASSEACAKAREEAESLREEGARYSEAFVAQDAARFRKKLMIPALLTLVFIVVAAFGWVGAAVLNDPALHLMAFALVLAAGPIVYTVILIIRRRSANSVFREQRADYNERVLGNRERISESALNEQRAHAEIERARERYRSELQSKQDKLRFIEDKIGSIEIDIRKNREHIDALKAEEQQDIRRESEARPEDGTPENEDHRKEPEIELAEIEEQLKQNEVQAQTLAVMFSEAEQEANRLKKEEETVRKEIGILREEASRRSGIMENLAESCPDPSEIEERIEETNDRIARAREYYEALKLASEAMSDAAKEMESIFAPQVNEIAGQYLSKLTEKRYAALRFDREFKVEISDRQDGMYHEADYFSAGTVDQIYLALRLAIADLIDPSDDKLPILLDDALVQYDDDRAKRAVRLFKDLSSRRQIIMFTCHKSIDILFREASADIKKAPQGAIDG
ncbi:MAG: AAA family ATPase [Clostridiales bacterium]|nr:AAA family ATPase [Clostridiales bacterium]